MQLVYSTLLDELDSSNVNMLQQIRENTGLIFSEVNAVSLSYGLYTENGDKFINLNDENNYTPDRLKLERDMLDYINILVNTRMYIHSIYVSMYDTPDRFLLSNDGPVSIDSHLDTSWIEDSIALRFHEENTWVKKREIRRYSFEAPEKVITIYRKLHHGIHPVGTIVLNIKASHIDNMLADLNLLPGQQINIYTSDGELVYSYENPTHSSDNSKMLIIEDFDGQYRYTSSIPEQQLYQLPSKVMAIISIIIIINVAIVFCIAYISSRRNYNRLLAIYNLIEATEQGKPIPELLPKSKDEYGHIIQNMIRVFIQSSYYKMQLSERKSKYEAMELMALQSQINPHFLFNTLETINWEVIDLAKGRNHVSTMIGCLSDVLQYSLSNPKEKVPLREEIHYTKSYLSIQEQRYNNRFAVVWEIDEELLDFTIVKLVLQPLIENSIYHGIKEKEGKSSLKIALRCCKSNIMLKVIDNGVGMSREKLTSLFEFESDSTSSKHIGLENVYKRLQLTYGSEFSFKVLSKEGFGTAITLTLPCDTTK